MQTDTGSSVATRNLQAKTQHHPQHPGDAADLTPLHDSGYIHYLAGERAGTDQLRSRHSVAFRGQGATAEEGHGSVGIRSLWSLRQGNTSRKAVAGQLQGRPFGSSQPGGTDVTPSFAENRRDRQDTQYRRSGLEGQYVLIAENQTKRRPEHSGELTLSPEAIIR